MGDNPHDRTDPRVSAAILTAHTRDGAQMAQKARIPQPVIDIIRQHHGDTPTIYFYDKAKKLYGDSIDISAFRYEGPCPQTREAAVVMLADGIEAATRAMSNPDPEKIDALIRNFVRARLNDGQLDSSDLTFSDLDKICGAFSTVLTGAFHERIEYPSVVIPPRGEIATEKAGDEETESGAAPAAQPSAKPAGGVPGTSPAASASASSPQPATANPAAAQGAANAGPQAATANPAAVQGAASTSAQSVRAANPAVRPNASSGTANSPAQPVLAHPVPGAPVPPMGGGAAQETSSAQPAVNARPSGQSPSVPEFVFPGRPVPPSEEEGGERV